MKVNVILSPCLANELSFSLLDLIDSNSIVGSVISIVTLSSSSPIEFEAKLFSLPAKSWTSIFHDTSPSSLLPLTTYSAL